LKRYEPKTPLQVEEERILLSLEKVIDPVCGMEIDPRRAIEYVYEDKLYHFCNPNCETHFKRNPDKFKNYDNMNPTLMMKSEVSEEVTDPVCGMKGNPEDWISYEFEGKDYYFCNESCRTEFKNNPEKFIKNNKKSESDKGMGKLKCQECDFEQEIPSHCGKPMHQEGDQLVCWMGASCGFQAIPEHHGKPMKIVE
jgi:YHS domain-containing protein